MGRVRRGGGVGGDGVLVLLELPDGLAVRARPALCVQTADPVECDGTGPFRWRDAVALGMVAEVCAVAPRRLGVAGVLRRDIRLRRQGVAQVGRSWLPANQCPDAFHPCLRAFCRVALLEKVHSSVDDHRGRRCLLRLQCIQSDDELRLLIERE